MAGQIAIIGLGQIGGSVGMALKQANSPLRRVGFDTEIGVLRAAMTLDAVDETPHRLPDAVRDADIVFLSLPLAEMPGMLKNIAPHLKESAVVMETSPVKTALIATLQSLVPDGRYFVGLVPALNVESFTDMETGLKAARPDLFKRTVMAIDLPRGVPEEVEQLAVNFVRLLGAKPLLADLDESDGMMAAAHVLPQLAAAALLNATVDRPGWLDGRKLAGRPYAGVTSGMAYYDGPASLRAAVLSNPRAALQALDVLLDSLGALRQEIESGDEQSVQQWLQSAFDARERWLNERSAAEWLHEGGAEADLPNIGEQIMQQFFGNSLVNRKKKKDKK
jgi:prephenate dehydrogenase